MGLSMRFQGDEGNARLLELLGRHEISIGEAAVAELLVEHGEVVEAAPGETLMKQGAESNDLHVILAGSVNVMVNGQSVAQRSAGDVVGEMVIVDSSARRSATVIVKEPFMGLRVSASAIEAIARKYPMLWKYFALTAGRRLAERSRFHLAPNETPMLFAGSSVEGLDIVSALAFGLKHDVHVVPWNSGRVFQASGVAVRDLLEQANTVDYAVFVFGPDDKTFSRGEEYDAPRDNVVFELGMFVGALGMGRVFVLMEDGADLKIPSDLKGITPLTYKVRNDSLHDAIMAVCAELCPVIRDQGVVNTRMSV